MTNNFKVRFKKDFVTISSCVRVKKFANLIIDDSLLIIEKI